MGECGGVAVLLLFEKLSFENKEMEQLCTALPPSTWLEGVDVGLGSWEEEVVQPCARRQVQTGVVRCVAVRCRCMPAPYLPSTILVFGFTFLQSSTPSCPPPICVSLFLLPPSCVAVGLQTLHLWQRMQECASSCSCCARASRFVAAPKVPLHRALHPGFWATGLRLVLMNSVVPLLGPSARTGSAAASLDCAAALHNTAASGVRVRTGCATAAAVAAAAAAASARLPQGLPFPSRANYPSPPRRRRILCPPLQPAAPPLRARPRRVQVLEPVRSPVPVPVPVPV